jgi:hypothetical protein
MSIKTALNSTYALHSAALLRRFVVSRLGALLALLFLMAPHVSYALTTISQSFVANEKLTPGTIVSLKKDTKDQVTAASLANANSLFGVVVGDGNSLMSLSSSEASRIQVATSGVVDVLVSDINGTVSVGDQITTSPVTGTGMKATGNAKIIGTAQATLNTTTQPQSYTDSTGKQKTLRLAQIPVLVNVAYYYRQPEKTIIPQAVQNVANTVAGKQVSSVPILMSIGIFLITLVVVVSIIYSMIHSSIISVGRNPLSQSAIYRDILQMSALVVGILAVSVVSIYMVLTKF